MRASRPATASSSPTACCTGYILSSYSARKLGLKTTGNAGGAHNLVVAPNLAGRHGGDAGAPRHGPAGDRTHGPGRQHRDRRLLARRGRLLGGERRQFNIPVAEITIAGNLRDMFKGIAAVGDDIDARGGTRVGSILLEEMTIAGE